MLSDNNSYGQLVRWRAYMPCAGCDGKHVDLAPGRLSDDSRTEICTCSVCGHADRYGAAVDCRNRLVHLT